MGTGNHRRARSSQRRTGRTLGVAAALVVLAGVLVVAVGIGTRTTATTTATTAAPAPTTSDGIPAPGTSASDTATSEVADLQRRVDEVVAASPLLFETDSPVPTAPARSGLETIGAILRTVPAGTVTVTGHVARATPPDPERGQRISDARAETAMTVLKGAGVAPDRLRAVGSGPADPGPDRDSARRVDVTVS